MADSVSQDASGAELNMARLLRDESLSQTEALERLESVPANEPFVLREVWGELARDSSLAGWRRLLACKVLITRCLTYPCEREHFFAAALRPLGLDETKIVDVTRAQVIPVERKEGRAAFMLPLPIQTSVGAAALYFALRRDADSVEEAALYPDPAAGEAQG